MSKTTTITANDKVVSLEERTNGESAIIKEIAANPEPKKMTFDEMREYFEEKSKINRKIYLAETKKAELERALLLLDSEKNEDEDNERYLSFGITTNYSKTDYLFQSKNIFVLREFITHLINTMNQKIDELKINLMA